MCFSSDDFESFLVGSRPDVVARKKNAQCCECLDNVCGRQVTMHTFKDQDARGALAVMYECDRCKIVREYIYRYERHEGCSPGESLAPYGYCCMRNWFDDREQNEQAGKYVWPETLDAAVALRESLADPDAALPPEQRYV